MQKHHEHIESYNLAQRAMGDLKTAVCQVLDKAGQGSLRSSEIGKSLGIYETHVRHKGYIPWTILHILQSEGIVEQGTDRRWRLRRRAEDA